MIKVKILGDLKTAAENLGFPSTDIVLSIPKNSQFGDYTTNLALQLSKQSSQNAKQNPTGIANSILEKFGKPEYLDKIEVAGNGFINLFIKDSYLLKVLQDGSFPDKKQSGKVLIEYGHVNPLKEVHIGHLRTFILGESISRIFDSVGYQVFRANYQGDIGLHIAKAIWGIKKIGMPSKDLSLEEKAKFLGQSYARGNESYEADDSVKKEIDQINKKLYKKDPELKDIYSLARNWSLEYFQPIYELLGVKYDRCFFESEVFEEGKKIVEDNIGKVFIKNDGAIIFPGEKIGLHNRVFITSASNPTYEGKEIGLAQLEYDTFNYDQSIHVVASEQDGYFQVVIAAIDKIFPYLKGKKKHLSYGVVDLKEGKMSSRTGNVITVDDLYKVVLEKVREVMKRNSLEIDQNIAKSIALGAIKFAYLKYSPRPNMIFDLEQSVSLDGDSGPYIQYTFARIQSVLKMLKKDIKLEEIDIETYERDILRSLLYFPEIVEQTSIELHPNILASYLIDLSKLYNLFYQKCRIIGSDKEEFRLNLSTAVSDVLKSGLFLLGIDAPEKM